MFKETKQTTPTPHVGGSFINLIHSDKLLAKVLNTSIHSIRNLRRKRVIPYIKTGHKSVIYDLNKVLAALETLEVKPVTVKGGR